MKKQNTGSDPSNGEWANKSTMDSIVEIERTNLIINPGTASDQVNLQVRDNPESADMVSLRHYIKLVLSSLWVLPVVIVVCVGCAFLLTKLMHKTYEVTTSVMVSKASLGQAANYDTVWTGMNLASTYAAMITSVNVLDQVRSSIDANISTEDLRTAITATPLVSSQLIQIKVDSYSPELAVQIANRLVEVFSSQIKNNQQELISAQDEASKTKLQAALDEITRLQEKLKAESLQLYNQRLDTINKSINDIQNQIEQVNQDMAPLQIKTPLSVAEQVELSNGASRKADLVTLLTQYQNELAAQTVKGPIVDLQDFQSSQDAALLDQDQRLYTTAIQDSRVLMQTTLQNMVTVTQVDQPTIPAGPVRPKLMINLALGFVAGLLLFVVYLFFANIYRNYKGNPDWKAYLNLLKDDQNP